MNYTIEQLKNVIGAKGVIKHKEAIVSKIFFDTRRIIAPKDSIFLCLEGKQRKGIDYLEDAYQKGIRHFIISTKEKDKIAYQDISILYVHNVLEALQKLSKYHREQFPWLEVIAITGSYGKTILKEWIFALLKEDISIVRSPNSYNSQIGVPLSILEIEKHHQLGIFEAGVSEKGMMKNLENIIQPTIGIYTNIGKEHDAGYSNISEKSFEKSLLFEHCKTIIFSADDKHVSKVMDKMKAEKKSNNISLVCWSRHSPEANLFITHESIDKFNTRIKATFRTHHIPVELSISFPFTDPHSIDLCIHAWCLMLMIRENRKEIEERFQKLLPFHAQIEMIKGIFNSTIYLDICDANPKNIERSVGYISSLKDKESQKQLVIMDELGRRESKDLMSQLSKWLDQKLIHNAYLLDNNAVLINKDYDNQKINIYPNDGELLDSLMSDGIRDNIILILGSRKENMNALVAHIEATNHNTSLEINLTALAHNVNQIQSLLKPNVRTMCIVKALSYGAGYHISKKLQTINVDYLAVAYTEEALALREQGIHLPIMVMCPEARSFKRMIENDLEPEIYSLSILEQFVRVLKQTDKNIYPIHLKIDTGMHRLGITKQELHAIIVMIKQNNVRVKSVFSHFSYAGSLKYKQRSLTQIKTFTSMTEAIEKALNYAFIKHICNTGGIIQFPDNHFDMVRLGIGMYGIADTPKLDMQSVLTLKTKIIHITFAPKGDFVGYSYEGNLKKDTLIATIPLGYADGFRRDFGNGRTSVYFRGKKVKTIGNICMDMSMIDVTGFEDVKQGEEIVLFKSPNDIKQLAKEADTIAYEILTGISGRVKRIYVEDK